MRQLAYSVLAWALWVGAALAQSTVIIQPNDVVVATPTVQTAAYAASNAIGGLQTLKVFRSVSDPGGISNYVQLMNKNAATTTVTVWAFDANPSASTCTDKAAFVLNSADLSKVLPGFPIALTPAAFQGATQTIAGLAVVSSSKNRDTAATQNIYVCLVSGGAFTPASTTDFILKWSIAKD